MGKNQIINTKFWDDSYIIELDPIEKLLFLYFLTNPLTNLSGIYEISLKRTAFDTGIDRDMIKKILERFSQDEKMHYIDGWIIIVHFLRYQTLNPNILKGIKKAFMELPEMIQKHKSLLKPLKDFQRLPKGGLLELEPELKLKFESKSETNRNPLVEDSVESRPSKNNLASLNQNLSPATPPPPNKKKSRAKHPAGALRPKPNPDVKKFIEWWSNQFQANFGAEYSVNWGKEGKLVQELLKTSSYIKLVRYAEQFFSDDDAFVKKAGYTIGVFSTQINKLKGNDGSGEHGPYATVNTEP
jgi:hypothetical protein